MAGRSKYSDADIESAIQSLADSGETPSISKIVALCPVARTRVQGILKAWNLSRTAEIIETADIPDRTLEGIVDNVKAAFSSLVLSERRSVSEAYQSQVNALSGLLDESKQTIEELETSQSQLQAELAAKKAECLSLTEDLLKSVGECRSYAQQILTEREKTDALTGENAKLKDTIATLENLNTDEAKAKILLLETELKQEQGRRQDSEQRERSTADKLAVSEDRAHALEDQIAELKQQIDEQASVIDEKEAKIQEQILDLRTERSRYGSVVAALQKLGMDVEGGRKPWEKKNRQDQQQSQDKTENPHTDTTEVLTDSKKATEQQKIVTSTPAPTTEQNDQDKHSEPVATEQENHTEEAAHDSTEQKEIDSVEHEATEQEPPIPFSPLPQEQSPGTQQKGSTEQPTPAEGERPIEHVTDNIVIRRSSSHGETAPHENFDATVAEITSHEIKDFSPFPEKTQDLERVFGKFAFERVSLLATSADDGQAEEQQKGDDTQTQQQNHVDYIGGETKKRTLSLI